MITVKADNRRRVQLPDVKPGQVFAFQDNGDDTITLIKVKAERKEPFPRGSLLKYLGAERDARDTAVANATVVGVPKDYRK